MDFERGIPGKFDFLMKLEAHRSGDASEQDRLIEFLDNLAASGMDYEAIAAHGFDFAVEMLNDNHIKQVKQQGGEFFEIYRAESMEKAARLLKDGMQHILRELKAKG